MYSILIVDDEENMLWSLDRALRNKEYSITCLGNPEEALEHCSDKKYDLVISDQRMPSMMGVDFLERLARKIPDSRRILISAYTDFYDVVEAFNQGIVHKFISKPWDNDLLKKLVAEQLNAKTQEDGSSILAKQDISKIKNDNQGPILFHNILTTDPTLKKQIEFIKNVAHSNAPFFIHGETGTGKELFAKAIHKESNRTKFPFIAVNCANFSESLLESQLFGHKKGAFTGASNDQDGYFKAADKGTLFLDEVTEIPLELQAKLLRVLQEKEFSPVGETKTIPFDIQIVSASSTSLNDAVNAGTFRSDLQYRLNVMPVTLPPLRERKDDIILLLEFFLNKEIESQNVIVNQVDDALLEYLNQYPWPGNVRELANICIYLTAVAPANDHKITLDCLPESILNQSDNNSAFIERRKQAINNSPATSANTINTQLITSEMIQQALHNNNGNKSLAAKELGISRMTLYRKMQDS